MFEQRPSLFPNNFSRALFRYSESNFGCTFPVKTLEIGKSHSMKKHPKFSKIAKFG